MLLYMDKLKLLTSRNNSFEIGGTIAKLFQVQEDTSNGLSVN